jgi:hypothetical protein
MPRPRSLRRSPRSCARVSAWNLSRDVSRSERPGRFRQARHLAYRAELRRAGLIAVNGPLDEQSDITLRGLSIFATDLDEARRLTDADPSVEAGR